jgi:hypothetical protein
MTARIWTTRDARVLSTKLLQSKSDSLRRDASDALASLAAQLDAFSWVECSLCHFRAPLFVEAGDADSLLKKHLADCPARP